MKTLCLLLLLLPAISWGQKNLDFLSSGELIQKGLEYYEKEDYYEAIQEYRKVSINDTNYASAQYEMAMSYVGMEQFKTAQDVLIDLLAFDLRYDFKHRVYSLLGTAYDNNKETDKALETYTNGLKLFPMQHSLYFNRAITYEGLKQYDKALEDYKQAAQCNMYHANSHLRLGIMAANEGMYTQATMSLMTFLLLEPTDSRAGQVIGLLESIADGSYEAEPKNIALSPDGDNYEELNLFYKNKIALQKNYKAKFTIPTAYARQMHMILKNARYDENNLEFWNQHYMPFFQRVWEEEKLDLMVMYTLINLDNDNVQGKLKSKIKPIKGFIQWAGANYRTATSKQYMEFEGKKQFIYVEYDSKYFSGYGKTKEDGTPIGTFYYFHPNGSKRMIAYFNDQGEATGTWELYNMYNGNIERKIEMSKAKEDRIQSDYFFSGELEQKYHLVSGLAEDTVYSYYRNGTLREIYSASKGNKNGAYKGYYPNGAMEYDIQYKDDKVDGNFISYHLNGQKKEEYACVLGKATGKRTVYYPDGKLQAEYVYENGLLNGPYTSYFADGKIEEKGTYKTGKRVGEMTEYHTNGEVRTSVVLDENGKENGNSVYYDYDGKKFHEFQFSKGGLTKIMFYDKTGAASESASKKGKKIDYILNYPNGTPKVRGQYVDDISEGRWEYFDRYGNIEVVENFKKGMLSDTVYTYHSNGQLKSISQYSEGERNGIYLAYNIFGELTDEGFYQNGYYDREWYSYFADGSISSESYFVEGTKHGIQKDYAVNGKMLSWETYDMGRVVSHIFLDTNEQIVDEYGEYNGIVELHNPINSYVNFRAEYKNGNADGEIQWIFPDKKPETAGSYINSERSGTWKWFHENGKLEREVAYVNGERQGTQKSYFKNGKVSAEETFVNDELQGPYKSFHDNGNMKTSGMMIDDNRHGKVTYYGPAQSVSMIRNYDQDVIVSYTYLDKEGKEVTPIPLDKKELKFVTYYKNGNKSNEHMRKNGLIEGSYIAYHENGQKWEDEMYLHGERHGKFFEYNEAGQKIYEADFKFGDLHGKEMTFYTNGKVKTEQSFLFGLLHGKSIEYAQDGKVLSITIYYNNEVVSIQKF